MIGNIKLRHVFACAIVLSAVALFPQTERSIIGRCLVLYVGAWAAFYLAITCVSRLPSWGLVIPNHFRKLLAQVPGLLIVCIYYLINGHNIVTKLAVLCLVLFYLKEIIKFSMTTISSFISLQQLRFDYALHQAPRLHVPHVIISCISPLSTKVLIRLIHGLARGVANREISANRRYQLFREADLEIGDKISKEQNSLQKWLIALGSLKRRLPSYLFSFSFIYDDPLKNAGGDFRDFVFDNAVLRLVSLPLSGVLLRRFSKGLFDKEDRKTIDLMMRRLPRYLRMRMRRHMRKVAEKERRFLGKMHTARGPIILVLSIPSFGGAGVELEKAAVSQGYLTASHSKSDPNRLTALTVETMANTALPIAGSDIRLHGALRDTVEQLANAGLAPLADCYLRFRLAYSDVERFLCLIDCFETLIKYSAFAYDHSHYPRGFGKRRPSLGDWVKLLRTLNQQIPGELKSDASLAHKVSDFWREHPAGVAISFVAVVKNRGLAPDNSMPESYLDFLAWLTTLRNQTKGHGGLQESTFAPIWHSFHETFLCMTLGLRALTLDSYLYIHTPAGVKIPMKGWLRGSLRTSTLRLPRQNIPDNSLTTSLGDGSFEHPLNPFVRFRGNTCLTWNGSGPEVDEYVDYSTGKLEEISRTRSSNAQ